MNKTVRESRHIWVGNLPENVREEQIQDYFSRFGRVEKVKLLTKTSPDGGKAAFVDFLDIRSATKANESLNRMGDRDLRTNYNEPGVNKAQDFGRVQQQQQQQVAGVRNNYGNYTPAGVQFRGQPMVIYAAPPPPVNHIIRNATVYPPQHQRDDRKVVFQPRRGRSPISRASASDDDHSVSPGRRARGTAEGSSDSEASVGKFNKRTTICIQNLVERSSDASLEESLYYEFKKYGAILNIVIKGTGAERFAYIKFMKSESADEAIHNSGKMFLGQEMKISMKGTGSKRRASRGGDEAFDPHATRTVFIGNLEKSTTHSELRGIFESFGEVVDVDIKKMQTGLTTYAFIQYIDIGSAMRAKRKMDRQYIGVNRLKVGYGRGTPTNSLWVGGLGSDITESQITKAFQPFGFVQRCLIDKQYWQALVRFETIEACTRAFAEMHGKQLAGKRLLVDYASPTCRDGFYGRMESNGLLDRRQLEPSPTPPDAHINFQNSARNGNRFQPRGTFTRPSFGANFSPQENNRDDYDDRHRYPIKNEYEKDLREYGAARDKYRSRREHSMSRDSLSPKRRKSRDSVSPVSSTSFYSDRKIKNKKEKKRKRAFDDSPPVDESSIKKMKKKKKEKKEKWKKEKIVKGSIELGYNMNEDEEELNKKNTPTLDGDPPELKTKIESKKEKKERKKLEKAEKARRKAEKKQKKLQKRKSIDDSSNNADLMSESVDDKNSIIKLVDVKIESGVENTVNDKTNVSTVNSNTQNTGNANSIPLEKADTKSANTTEPNIPNNTAVTENGVIPPVSVKLEPNVEEPVAEELKTNVKAAVPKDTPTEKNTPKENPVPKINGATLDNIKVENDSVINDDNTISSNNHPKHDNITNPEKTVEKKQSNKKRKSTSEKEKKDKSRNNNTENKESSDSTSSSSSSSSESEDSDESSDEEEDVKDIKSRPYRQSNKDNRNNENTSSHELDKKNNDVKPREPKAYRQGTKSEYSLRDGRRGHGKSKYTTSDPRKNNQPTTASNYGLSDNHRSPQPNIVGRRPSSACGKLSGRNNSPNARRSPNVSERTRSRSPYERRRGHSPATRSKTSERKELFRNEHHTHEHTQRTPPPPPQLPLKVEPKDIKPKPIYPTKPPTMVNQTYPGTPAAAATATTTTGATENPDTLLDLLRRFPVMWQGLLGLKNDTAAVQMHFLSGNVNLAESSLPRGAQPHDVPPPLRISQRMKLEPSQLEGVDKRILHPKEHCMLLALPCGRDPLDVHAQTRALKTGFITYLQQKQAAGIINVTSPMNKTTSFVVHIFPPCDFAQGHLARVAPDLLNSAADSGHLMVLITPL